MKKINRDVAKKAFQEYYKPKADDKKLAKSEILSVVIKALSEYGVATLTGADVNDSDSPFDLYFILGDKQIRLNMSCPSELYRHTRTYMNQMEVGHLEDKQYELDRR